MGQVAIRLYISYYLSERGPEVGNLSEQSVVSRRTFDHPLLESRAADLCGPLQGKPPVTAVHLTTEMIS